MWKAVEKPPPENNERDRPLVAFGPELAEVGSWEWVGADLARELSGRFRTCRFRENLPTCDVVVLVKYHAAGLIPMVPAGTPIVYCPIDAYGSAAEIDADWRLLRRCARIVIHAEPLRQYFQSYAPVDYLDHHIKFAAPVRTAFHESGPIVWVGLRSNLGPLVDWVNRHGLPHELVVLTNWRQNEPPPTPAGLGFHPDCHVQVERWSAGRQRELMAAARAAIDIKGDDFRQRHKPPAKAIDFIASGLPLAMNADSSSSRHLKRLGFDVALPEEPERWLSRNYWEETSACGRRLRGELSRQQVAASLARIIDDVLADQKVNP